MTSAKPGRPKLGFVGVGWIGYDRLRAIVESDAADVVALADPSAELRERASSLVPHAQQLASHEELLSVPMDGVVIATPSALHAAQTAAFVARRRAVFCQKPLGRSAAETLAVVNAAKRADVLLDVDFSYRQTRAMQAVKSVVASGELGDIFSARFVFHNAYGPDKPWYFDKARSGGGCVMDLGIHLVNLALWLLDEPTCSNVSSALYAKGKRLEADHSEVEDYAVAHMQTPHGCLVEIACSWNLPAGTDAIISAELYGPRGGVAFRNVNGSFYDFVAERMHGTKREELVTPPDPWGGRCVVEWVRQLASNPRFDSAAERFVQVAAIIDRIYGRA